MLEIEGRGAGAMTEEIIDTIIAGIQLAATACVIWWMITVLTP